MIDLINPGLLWFIPLVLLPILIHFLNQHFPKEMTFSNITLIQEVMAGRKKWFRLRDLFFLLIRTLILLFLVALFLKPILDIFETVDPDQKQRRVAIVIDQSYSMNHTGGTLSPLEKAKSESIKLLRSLNREDLVFLIVLGSKAQTPFTEWTQDHRDLEQWIHSLEKGYSSTKPEHFIQQLNALKEPATELFVFSDFQKSQWSSLNLLDLEVPPQVFLNALHHKNTSNKAITQVKLAQGRPKAGQSLSFLVDVVNESPQELQTTLLCQQGNDVITRQKVSIPAHRQQQIQLNTPPFKDGETPLHFRLDSTDDLSEDNHYHISFKVEESERVALISDQPDSDSVFYLSKAIAPFRHKKGPLQLVELHGQERLDLPFMGIDKVVVSRLGQMPLEQLKALVQFISKGGQALFFLDGDLDADNLKALASLANETLPFELGAIIQSENMLGGTQQWGWADFDSPLLSLFEGEKRHLLSQVETYRYRHLSHSEDIQVHLKYRDQTPALFTWDISQGRLILFNISTDELYSSLPRHALFPAWFHHILNHLDHGQDRPLSQTLKKLWHGTWWHEDTLGLKLTNPEYAEVLPTLHHGDRRVDIEFQPTLPGIYQLHSTKKVQNIAFNIPPSESDPTSLDPELLTTRMKGHGGQYFVSGLDDYQTIQKGLPLMPYLLMGCLVWLLTESLALIWIARDDT